MLISSGQGPGPGVAGRSGWELLGADIGSSGSQGAQAQAQDLSQILKTKTCPPTMGEALTWAGETVDRPIVRSRLLATVMMWANKWPRRKVIDLMIRNYVDNEMFKAMELLAEAMGMSAPDKRRDSMGRSSEEAYAFDLYGKLMELDKEKKLPEIVVPCLELAECPVDTVQDGDPGILVRMERLERAVTKLLETPNVAAGGAGGGGGFGPALQRARSLSHGREPVAAVMDQEGQGQGQESYANRVASGGVKRVRAEPGTVDSEGFRVPGRPVRKAVPRGSSTVDLTELGGAMVAPIERYVGNTDQRVTSEIVEKALKLCAAGLPGELKLEVLKVEQINAHLPHVRTKAWKVTVPYSCREIMDNPALYPDGWTHRAYFAPRTERSKRVKPNENQTAGVVESLLQSEERATVSREQEEREVYAQKVQAAVDAELARLKASGLQLA